ncbi:hypothetical protein SDC9_207654 [bioreactor metagenome]|uniref:Uncharacterized protein n=1 Tax=bioreactor metagenome TaxID=1076179 RepID=A0A645J8H4_9ZZZZ
MAVGADAQDLQIDATGSDDRLLVLVAHRRKVCGQAIRAVDCGRREVDPVDEIPADDVVVGLAVVRCKPDVFVEGEGAGLGERHLTGLPAADQLVVDGHR